MRIEAPAMHKTLACLIPGHYEAGMVGRIRVMP